MNDQFHEEVVTQRKQGMQSVALALATVMMVVMAIIGIMGMQSVITAVSLMMSGQAGAEALVVPAVMLAVGGGIAVLLFLKRDEIRTEYEYTITNATLDFAKVFNNKKRKALGTMQLKNIEACGKVSSGSFHRYISMPGIKRTNWFLNREADLFYLYYTKNGEKKIIIIEPSEELVEMIRRVVLPGVYQTN